MASRIASAAIALPLLVLVVWIGSPWFTVLVAVVAAIGALELSAIARPRGGRQVALVTAVGATALVAVAHFLGGASLSETPAAPIVGLGATLSLIWLLWRPRAGTRVSGLLTTAGVAVYVGGFLFHAPLLRELDQGREWVFLLLAATFAMDTCAFFAGRAFGSRPLAPSISPSKTWEGAIAGVAGALGASVAAVRVLGLDAGMTEALVLGVLIGTVGQIGDLAESRLKRMAGVKDSGRLLPGHGGVLDRLDSIVLNLAVVYYLVS